MIVGGTQVMELTKDHGSRWIVIGVFILLVSAGLAPNSSSEKFPPEPPANYLLADYTFNGSGLNSFGMVGSFELSNTEFVENTLYLNGCYEGGPKNGYSAIARMHWLGYSSFTVSLEFKPLSSSRSSNILTRLFNLSSEDMGNVVTCGTSYRWFGISRNENEALEVTLNNQDYVHTYEDDYVNGKAWNRVTCCVDLENLLIRTFLNSKKLEEVHLPSDFALRVVDSGKKWTDKNITFTNYSNGKTLHGYVDNLKIFCKALSDEQVLALSFEHPLGKRHWRDWIIWIIVVACFLLLGMKFHWCRRKRAGVEVSGAVN